MNRCVDIVIGMQAGSEAKGAIATVIDKKYKALVRTGSVNAAHTAYYKDEKVCWHQLPCGSLHFGDAKIILGAGAQIDVDYLQREIEVLKKFNKWLGPDGKPRLVIDPHATIIEPIDKMAENGGRMPDCGDLYFHPRDCDIHNYQLNDSCMGCSKLPSDSAWAKLGSTTHGSGANLVRRIVRGTKMAVLLGQKIDLVAMLHEHFNEKEPHYDEIREKVLDLISDDALITRWASAVEVKPIKFADEHEITQFFIGDTVYILNRLIDKDEDIILEGTQGSILSLYHGYRNKCTSRDTNAANWCMEAGISPLAVRDVWGVARTFPIRVAGDSGPMSGTEITWEEVTKHAESPEPIVEVTSATKRKRRVFLFGQEDFKRALDINRPTKLALTFIDYLHYSDFGKTSWDSLTQKSRDWITTLESKLGVFFNILSTGPKPEHKIFRKTTGELLGRIQSNSEDTIL